MSEIQNNQNSMSSMYSSGNAFINLSEQKNLASIIADGNIDENEILSMSLMYEGSQTTVASLLESASGKVNIKVYHGDVADAENIDIAEMSSYGATTTTTAGLSQQDVYNQLIEDMILDELEEQLKKTASQGIGEFSYDQD
ncbi:MAG: hypothetical protein PHF25_02155 [Candidatus Margulisbacteria bacterium]|nr:hypothetical protein [Candidatus Margulisiibacteriota bacterium]